MCIGGRRHVLLDLVGEADKARRGAEVASVHPTFELVQHPSQASVLRHAEALSSCSEILRGGRVLVPWVASWMQPRAILTPQ